MPALDCARMQPRAARWHSEVADKQLSGPASRISTLRRAALTSQPCMGLATMPTVAQKSRAVSARGRVSYLQMAAVLLSYGTALQHDFR